MEGRLASTLARGRSTLLLGARQTGKTTLAQRLNPDMQLNFIRPEVRQRYERRPELLGAEVESHPAPSKRKLPLVLLDEVQRVPELVNVVQDLVDRRIAQFILTGSSARKLRRGRGTNWLPGRLVPLRLDPLTLAERTPPTLEEGLLTGALPGIVSVAGDAAREQDLRGYASLYLEEEVRAEALVRNLGQFSRFLQLAALESGGISHFRGLAQELGVAHTTVAGYYEILEDCLIAERVEPLTQSRTRKKLTKSPRYCFRPGRSPRGRGGRPASAAAGVGWLVRAVRRAGVHPAGPPRAARGAGAILARPRRSRSGLGADSRGPLPARRGEMERSPGSSGCSPPGNVSSRTSQRPQWPRDLPRAEAVSIGPRHRGAALAGNPDRHRGIPRLTRPRYPQGGPAS